MKDSSLIARKLAPIRHVICGSPGYFQKYGKPETLADLKHHRGLLYSYGNERQGWQFSGSSPIAVEWNFTCNNGDVLREMAVAGCGLAYLPTFIIHKAVEDGRLETCLTQYAREPIGLQAVYPSSKNLSTKVRVFIDFLVEWVGPGPHWDRSIFGPEKI